MNPAAREQLRIEVKDGFWAKFKGGEMPIPAMPPIRAIALAWLGGVLAISLVAGLSNLVSMPLLLGSFGATCVLAFGYPDAPFSQPRNIVVGHFISSLIGVTFLMVFGPHWWAAGLATGTAIAAMMLTRTVHPPAGSNPVIVFLAQPGWGFLFYPTLLGALAVALLAAVYNNATRSSNYPKYW